MTNKTYSALFDNETLAQGAVDTLIHAGLDKDKISMVKKHEGETVVTDGEGDLQGSTAASVAGKAAIGAGAGTILGIAALAIPGVGPFVAAGAIAQAAIGGAAVTGAVAGAVAGGIAGALQRHGIEQADAEFYERELSAGRVLLIVDVDAEVTETLTYLDILRSEGGYSHGHPRTA